MKNDINIAVVGLGQIGNYLLNELKNKKKEIKLLTGKNINVVAISAKNKNKKIQYLLNFEILIVFRYGIKPDKIQEFLMFY